MDVNVMDVTTEKEKRSCKSLYRVARALNSFVLVLVPLFPRERIHVPFVVSARERITWMMPLVRKDHSFGKF